MYLFQSKPDKADWNSGVPVVNIHKHVLRSKCLSSRHARCAVILATVLTGLSPRGLGHETDQYSVPTGREFADLRLWLSEYMYDAIEKGVNKTNKRIAGSLKHGQPTARTLELQSPKTIVTAVYFQFPSFVIHTDDLEQKLASAKLKSRYPGLVTGHLPPLWIYHHPALMVDITKFARWLRTSTLMVNGTYFGTDKILHFVHVGYIYHQAYQTSLDQGCSEGEAVRRAVEVGAGAHPLAETRILGFIATGVISNGDLVADYAGWKFFRNLTESVRIKGEMRPPMLVRDGEYYRFNTHVRRNSDFFSVFVSDHWNESLNPSEYAAGTGISVWIGEEIRKRCPDIINWYRDDQGRPFTKEDFERVARELTTYYGEDYGHQGNLEEMTTVANLCFESDSVHKVSASAKALRGAGTSFARVAAPSTPHATPPDNPRDALGRTALWRAARAGRLEEVELLLAEKQDVDTPDVDAETPLHAASRAGHAAIVGALLQHGASANARNVHGLTPLHLATQNGCVKALQLLLQSGADVDAQDHFGCTPLHDAGARGNGPAAAALVKAAASVNAPDRFGTTPLQRAARAGHVEVERILRNKP